MVKKKYKIGHGEGYTVSRTKYPRGVDKVSFESGNFEQSQTTVRGKKNLRQDTYKSSTGRKVKKY